MEIKFETTDGWMLTTEHPASHYQAGVLVCGEIEGSFGPTDSLPVGEKAMNFFGVDCPVYTAGDFIVNRAKERIWSDDEIALMKRFLSQDPQKSYVLPDDIKLRCEQAKNHFNIVVGDITQGVHKVYLQLGKAQVAVDMYEATKGKYTTNDWLDVIEA